ETISVSSFRSKPGAAELRRLARRESGRVCASAARPCIVGRARKQRFSGSGEMVMTHLGPQKSGLVLGALVGRWHLLWAITVAAGWGRSVMKRRIRTNVYYPFSHYAPHFGHLDPKCRARRC